MEKCEKWKRILLHTASYIFVAALASFVTILFLGGNTKIVQLEKIITTHFVGEVDQTAMEDAAAKAMVEALGDPWSYYVSAKDYAAHKERKTNSYVRIGISFAKRSDGTGFDILSVVEDGPAGQAGILPGDILIEADGQSVAGMESDGLVQIVRGGAGRKLTLTVLRQGEKLKFAVAREKIETVVATGKMLEDQIGYVLIRNFNANCAEQTLAVIEDLLDQGAQKLVFDVRNNPGGYVDEMNKILDFLLPEGVLFRAVDYKGTESVDTSDEKCLDMPMAVLVNRQSYSCAEFFAAAMQEYDWAIVAGTPTIGKGYFQNTFRMSDGSAVGLSVGQYYTPNGVSLAQEGGLVPDVTVEIDQQTEELIYAGQIPPEEDPQVLAAIQALQ